MSWYILILKLVFQKVETHFWTLAPFCSSSSTCYLVFLLTGVISYPRKCRLTCLIPVSSGSNFCYYVLFYYRPRFLVVINVRYYFIFIFVLSSTLINGKSHRPSNPALIFSNSCFLKDIWFLGKFSISSSFGSWAGSVHYVRAHIDEPPCLGISSQYIEPCCFSMHK